MFKKIPFIFLILFVSTSLVASDNGETAGSRFKKNYSYTSDILGSGLEKSSTSSGDSTGPKVEKTSSAGDDSAILQAEKSVYRIVLYPYIGGGLSFADYTAWSGRDLGLYYFGDPNLYNDAEYSYPLIWGAGVMVDYFILGRLAFSSGLSYDNSEFKTVYAVKGYDDGVELRADFIFLTIPLGLHYYFNKLFVAGGGLYYGLLISDDSYVNGEGGDSLGGKDDIGIFLDLGVNFNLTDRNSIMIFARYKHGLVNVYDEEDIVTDIKLRTLTLNLSTGIRF